MQILFKKSIILLLLAVPLTACAKEKVESTKSESIAEQLESTVEVESETEAVSEKRNDIVIGQWAVGGVFTDNKLIDISTVDALKDLYDGIYLTVSDDGSFVMLNSIFVGEGDWEEINTSEYEHAYLLSEHQSYRYTFDSGKLDQTDPKPSEKKYVMCITNEDDNSALIMEQNEDEEKQASSVKVWVRSDTNSKYLSLYSTPVTGEKNAENNNQNSYNVSSQKSSSKTQSPENLSSGMRNALGRAHDYLGVMAFSAEGLKEQLEYEGFSSTDAQYAVDHCGADWKYQAKLKAQDYLDIMSFSYDGLVEQLEYDGFTHQEAVYGADQVY